MDFQNKITVQTIADLIGAKDTIGDIDFQCTGLNEIHKVKKGNISFVDHPKYYAASLNSDADVILINSIDVDNPKNKILILVDEPFTAYNKIVKTYQSDEFTNHNIHPSVKISSSASLGPNVVVGANCTIDDDTRIHGNVVIYPNCKIGKNVIIHSNASIGADAFYYKNRGDYFERLETCGRVIIEDSAEIGANCTIDRGVSGDTIIGQSTKIDNHVHIGHGVTIGSCCLIAAQVGIAGKTRIGNNVTIWGQAGLNKDLKIEDNAIILAQSGVGRDISKGQVVFGSPAQEARKAMKDLAYVKRLKELFSK